jgi:hypothetical protein
MNEESVQRLFSDLRNAPSETSIEDVSNWINTPKINNPVTDTTHILTKSKIIFMTASIAIILTSTILLLTSKSYQDPAKTEISPIPVNKQSHDPDTPASTNQIPLNRELPVEDTSQSKPILGPALYQVIPMPNVSSESQQEIEAIADITQRNQDNISMTPTSKSEEPIITLVPADTTGFWTTNTEKLTIDTVFAGVTKLVLTGKHPSQIKVEGSQRNTIAFNYQYNYQIKGIYAGKNPGSKVTYKKSGSTLIIMVELNKVITVGVSHGKVMSNVSLAVPENINVSINSSYGDITGKQLSGGIIQLNTKYGDIEAQSLSGNINLQSGYGDITLNEVVGKLEVSTKYGDIKAYEIKADESILLSSGYGDVDCKLLNKEGSCRLNLSTGFGKLNIKGKELDIESTKKIQYGKGPTSVIASSSFGNVKIRFSEIFIK